LGIPNKRKSGKSTPIISPVKNTFSAHPVLQLTRKEKQISLDFTKRDSTVSVRNYNFAIKSRSKIINEMKLPEFERLERQKAIIESQIKTLDKSPVRECFAVYVKEWDKSSKLCSLCTECINSIEPPTKRRKDGVSFVRRCDWCGARNTV
jgi:hypothetical protein